MNDNIDIYFFTDLKLDTKMSTNSVDYFAMLLI